jgi:hypothetical protein
MKHINKREVGEVLSAFGLVMMLVLIINLLVMSLGRQTVDSQLLSDCIAKSVENK